MHFDWVFYGSVLTIALAVVVVVFLAIKINKLMKRDSEKHSQS